MSDFPNEITIKKTKAGFVLEADPKGVSWPTSITCTTFNEVVGELAEFFNVGPNNLAGVITRAKDLMQFEHRTRGCLPSSPSRDWPYNG